MRKYQSVARELGKVERAASWNPQLRRLLSTAPAVVIFALLSARPASAGCTFNPKPDPTVDGSSNSLRSTIQMANASGQNCAIDLAAGTYTLTIKNSSGQDNTAAEGDLDITSRGHTLTIQGTGAGVSVVNANGIDRAFQVLGGANAAFRRMTIEGGVAQDDGTSGALAGSTAAEGGGVLVQDGGHVNFFQVALQNNKALGGRGVDGAFVGTSHSGGLLPGQPGTAGQAAAGGGLFVSAGTVDLRNSQLSGNTSAGGAGGAGGANFFVTSAVVSAAFGASGVGGNAAGGGLYLLSGNVRLSRSTAANNSAAGGAGGNPGNIVGKESIIRLGSAQTGERRRALACTLGKGLCAWGQTTVSGNAASGGTGGGFACTGGCIGGTAVPVAGTGGSSLGAGMFVGNGDITVANSTLFANMAKGGSGGTIPTRFFSSESFNIHQGAGGNGAGGGLYASGGSLSLTGVTLASNQALTTSVELTPAGASTGGGIDNVGATSLVANTTLIGDNTQDSGNISNGNDVFGAITASSTLIGQSAGAIITGSSNLLDVNPRLDPAGLLHNGGPTQTVALQSGSPALDTGDAAVCAAPPPGGLGGMDQRGAKRFDSGESTCDIGAFESSK